MLSGRIYISRGGLHDVGEDFKRFANSVYVLPVWPEDVNELSSGLAQFLFNKCVRAQSITQSHSQGRRKLNNRSEGRIDQTRVSLSSSACLFFLGGEWNKTNLMCGLVLRMDSQNFYDFFPLITGGCISHLFEEVLHTGDMGIVRERRKQAPNFTQPRTHPNVDKIKLSRNFTAVNTQCHSSWGEEVDRLQTRHTAVRQVFTSCADRHLKTKFLHFKQGQFAAQSPVDEYQKNNKSLHGIPSPQETNKVQQPFVVWEDTGRGSTKCPG